MTIESVVFRKDLDHAEIDNASRTIRINAPSFSLILFIGLHTPSRTRIGLTINRSLFQNSTFSGQITG
jgi:hypothetical protein